MRIAPYLLAFALCCFASTVEAAEWRRLDATMMLALQDDDLNRHKNDPAFLESIGVSETRFSENGFDWHLMAFSIRETASSGALWVVPHDDEDAAFDSMIAALRRHGGIGVVVNTGNVGTRRQPGRGYCGLGPTIALACDPNRNFDERAPIFTHTILQQRRPGQAVIALHSNSPGFSGDGKGGRGNITMLDSAAFARGKLIARTDGYFGRNGPDIVADADVYVILPYRSGGTIHELHANCRKGLNESGVNVWHERVGTSDGSMSNYIALSTRGINYVNFEAKREKDLSIGVEVHRLMIDAYFEKCQTFGPASESTSTIHQKSAQPASLTGQAQQAQ